MLRERIKERMKERGITGKALAKMTNVDASTVSRYLRGLTVMPLTFVEVVCRELDIPFEEEEVSDELPVPDFEGKNVEFFLNALDIYNMRLKEKNERIKELKAEIADKQHRIDKKDRLLFILAIIIAALAVWNIYYTIDSHNGNWGIVQYEDGHLELVPRVSETYDDGSYTIGDDDSVNEGILDSLQIQ